ncbi:branched-chain amino acid ABC transporter permease [Leekyejoonella antrihumi]|uniref:Branched-chain amino acid ABC transporter permease n=2 Tax=Leekyejoonella antrihumi TaxID=1660198 RepID=A0A563E846_9MICO|nr:branched-chain amino acid ABC transporter permease [Leekyejoonella antrihumi]
MDDASSPVAAKDSTSQSIFGTVRSPAGKPLAGLTITVTRGGKKVGSATTDNKGSWKIPVPGHGTYVVALDVGTLPKGLQVRTKGGETLGHVDVSTGEDQPVLFGLAAAGAPQEKSTPGATSAPASAAPTSEASGGDRTSGFGSRAMQLLIGGIEYGSIIAITAVGLSLVFGTTRLINFAHGEMVMMGAVVAFIMSTGSGGLPLAAAAVVAMIAVGALGAGFELVLWRPLRKRGAGLIQMFIISIGLSLFVRHVVLAFFGGRRRQYDQYAVQDSIRLGAIEITPRDLTITLISLAILVGVALVLQHTRIGKATRAVADNKDLAEASGIDVNRVILVVWVAGGALAGLGGVFFGLSEAVFWNMGFNLLLLMFAGIIVGGLGSAYGAIIGSLLVGLVAQLSTLWFSPELQSAWALLALIVVLLFRPQGILGRAERAG